MTCGWCGERLERCPDCGRWFTCTCGGYYDDGGGDRGACSTCGSDADDAGPEEPTRADLETEEELEAAKYR